MPPSWSAGKRFRAEVPPLATPASSVPPLLTSQRARRPLPAPSLEFGLKHYWLGLAKSNCVFQTKHALAAFLPHTPVEFLTSSALRPVLTSYIEPIFRVVSPFFSMP